MVPFFEYILHPSFLRNDHEHFNSSGATDLSSLRDE